MLRGAIPTLRVTHQEPGRRRRPQRFVASPVPVSIPSRCANSQTRRCLSPGMTGYKERGRQWWPSVAMNRHIWRTDPGSLI